MGALYHLSELEPEPRLLRTEILHCTPDVGQPCLQMAVASIIWSVHQLASRKAVQAQCLMLAHGTSAVHTCTLGVDGHHGK